MHLLLFCEVVEEDNDEGEEQLFSYLPFVSQKNITSHFLQQGRFLQNYLIVDFPVKSGRSAQNVRQRIHLTLRIAFFSY